jgi:preprotein translocase SecE subunit
MGKWIGWIILAAVIIAGVVIVFLRRQFIKEAYQELQKVTWPTKDEALNSAMVTIVFIVGFSLILVTIDLLVHRVNILLGLVK